MVRDPPRKSEQTFRAIRTWGHRVQSRRREPTACTERRCGYGRRRRHSVRIHGPQWQRLYRLLAEASPVALTRICRSCRSPPRTPSYRKDQQRNARLCATVKMWEVLESFIFSNCGDGAPFASTWRKIWLNIYAKTTSRYGTILLNNGEDMSNLGQQYFSTLYHRMFGLDGVVAYASLTTLTALMVLQNLPICRDLIRHVFTSLPPSSLLIAR